MKKEPLVFLITIAILAALWFLSSSDEPATVTVRRGGVRGPDAQAPLEARRTPGRFLAPTEVTWAANASNIFETPTETRDLSPLDVSPPPFPRLPHPGPPLPIPLNAKARTGLRRVIVPAPQPASTDGSNGGGAATVQDSGGGAAGSGSGTATQPASSGPLIPLGKELTAVDRIKLSMEAELKQAEEAAKAKQSEEDRRKALDKLVFTNQTVEYGELGAEKNENRYQVKADLDKLRTDPSLTEPERNDRLKKFNLKWRQDKRGKLGKAVPYTGADVQQVTFADTVENRYRLSLLTAEKKDVNVQTELIKEVFGARQFKLAAEHLQAMRKAGLASVESLTMLADSLHELFDYNAELEVLRQAAKDFPESVPLIARLGRLQAILGLNEDARATFAAVLAKNPSDPLANLGMAALLMRTGGDANQAIKHLKEALNMAPASDPVRVDTIRLYTAEAYVSLGDFRNASETVDLVLQRSNVTAPERQRLFERAFTLAAVSALGQGQLAEARARAEEGAKRYPLSGQLQLLLGVVMMQQGELAGARSKLAVAVELDPLLTGHAQVALAALEEAAARDNEAVAAAEAGALTASPAAMELRLPFGRALLHVADLTRARDQLLIALDAEPKSADILAALGDVAYAENNLPDAIRFYDRAAAAEATFPQLLPRRIVTQVRRRKLAEAEELAKTVTTNPTDPFLRAALAYFQYSKGNHAEALQLLQQLSEANAGRLSEYAAEVHKAVVAHQKKTMWVDGFSRPASGGLGRDWKREVGTGINTAISGQLLTFEGTQRGTSDAPTMIWQERPGDKLWGFSVDLDMPSQPGVYAGVGLMVMNQTARPGSWPGSPDPKSHGGLSGYTGMQVALSPENKLVYRSLVKGVMGEWKPVPIATYTSGAVTLELRLSEPKEGRVELFVNRESVLKEDFADLKRFRRTVELQIFCQAQIDRKVHFTADNVVIVTLKE